MRRDRRLRFPSLRGMELDKLRAFPDHGKQQHACDCRCGRHVPSPGRFAPDRGQSYRRQYHQKELCAAQHSM